MDVRAADFAGPWSQHVSALDDPGGLSSLLSTVPPLSPDTSTMEAYDAFSSNPSLYALAVVDDDERPVGILNRFTFLERLSRPFGRDLLTPQPVERAMDPAPRVVDECVSLDVLNSALVDDTTKYMSDGFIVTRTGRTTTA